MRAARALLAEWSEEGVDEAGAPARGSAGSARRGRRPQRAARARGSRAAERARAPGALASRCASSSASARAAASTRGARELVFGDGDPDAELMFIGEGPGEQEDLQGLPFVGRAGELLTRMIERGLGVPRSSVYICNIVKCRPPGNRTPLADEVSTCRPFLDGQIDAIAPRVIVTLGKPASSLLLGRDVSITRVRGIWHDYRGIPVMPTFHPAFLLRQYTEQNRRLVWEDLKAAHERARRDG